MITKILIIGNGYVGNSLSRELHRNNIPHVIISRAQVDYTDPDKLNSFVKSHRFVAAVNCSGYTGRPNVDAAEKERDKCYLLNVTTPISIYDVCEKNGIRYYHISSGCIYTGYDQLWSEDDDPNFGINNPDASWYSKTKHMAEDALKSEPCYCVRVRMPFDDNLSNDRNLLTKLLRYDNLVNTLNTKTYIPHLVQFLKALILSTFVVTTHKMEIFNYGCIEPLSTRQIVDVLKSKGLSNDDWKIVNWDELDIVANRSNCILTMEKAMIAGYNIYTERECLDGALENI